MDRCEDCMNIRCICDTLHQEDRDRQEFTDSLKGRKALNRWAKLQDENPGC